MNVIGHQKITQYLEKSLERDKLAQAYLFSGPEHVGKFTLAKIFCEKLTEVKDAKINPNLHIISPQTEEIRGVLKKKNIQIEEIRDLQKEISLSSYSEGKRTVIIDDAERMTAAAQNALLKTLEEPPSGSVIILVCHDEKKILATVKSRCVIKRFNLVNDCGTDPEINFWSFGRPGLAVKFSQNSKELGKAKDAKKKLEKLLEQNIQEKFEMAENLSKDLPQLLETLDVWSALLRSRLIAGNIFPAMGKNRALNGLNLIEKNAALLRDTNSNARLVLENLFLNL